MSEAKIEAKHKEIWANFMKEKQELNPRMETGEAPGYSVIRKSE